MKLPWPPKIPNPNSIAHWGRKASIKKKYKMDCYILAKAEGKRKFAPGEIKLKISFYPPDNRKRDLDNMLASIKALLDGVATAWEVNDERFHLTLVKGEPVKDGAVKIEIL